MPTVNGYRRLGPRHTLAPTRVDWSTEDRSAMLRMVGGGTGAHIENRSAEPCANPYLAVAGQLFAGLEGLGGAADTGRSPRAAGPAPEFVPQSLAESLDAFRAGRADRLLGAP